MNLMFGWSIWQTARRSILSIRDRPLIAKLPIFALDPEMAKSKIGKLEFGRELEFFRANGAKPVDGPKLEFKANYFALTIADYVLTLRYSRAYLDRSDPWQQGG
jgi:hypothetical protein